MKKHTKIIIAAALLALVIGGFWFYNEQELNLPDMVPDEVWKFQIFIVEDGDGAADVEADEQMLSSILDAVNATTVTRGPEFHTSTNSYSLYLYPYEGYPTLIIVRSDGRIALAKNLDLDHYRYYKDGGELYAALVEILSK